MPTLFDKAVRHLSQHADEILNHQNELGEFWPDAGFRAPYNTDYQQFAYYPLAWLFTLDHPENPWKGHPRLLMAVERSFKNNLRVLQENGTFLGSSHDAAPYPYAGNWRSFSWLRSWELMRGHIGRELFDQCEAGLRRTLVAQHEQSKKEISEKGYGVNYNVRNHPVWHLTALLALAKAFGDESKSAWACSELERVCACQHPAGLWYEHDGPVMVYQHVTMNGLSHYHALTGSPAAAAALDKCLKFFRIFTYPNGCPVETLDGRVRYTGYVMSIHPATWARSAEGRAHLHFLLDKLLAQPLGPGYQTHGGWLGLPFFTQFARDLPQSEPAEKSNVPALTGDGVHSVPELPVRVIRRGPWTVTLSGFTRPEMPGQRWCLDFQAHLSVFHEHCRLIIGGGGAKRQAALSLFSGGSRPLGLPSLATSGAAETTGDASARLTLKYPDFTATLEVSVEESQVRLAASVARASRPQELAAETAALRVYMQLPFPMKGDARIVTAAGSRPEMDCQDELTSEAMGEWIGREGKFRIRGVAGGRALIHLLPYNTHWRDGRAPAEKAMGIVAVPVKDGDVKTVIVEPDYKK